MPETDDSRTRIYVLARELGEQPKEVLERAQRLGFPVTTVLHSLDPRESSRVLDSFSDVEVGAQSNATPGPERGGPPNAKDDAVTAVTIISVQPEGTAPGEVTPAPRSQHALQDDSAESMQIPADEDTAEDDQALTAPGVQSPATLVQFRSADEAENWPTQDNGQQDGPTVQPNDLTDEDDDDPTESASTPSGGKSGAAIPGDPWEIGALLEETTSVPTPLARPGPMEANAVGTDAVQAEAISEGTNEEPGVEEFDEAGVFGVGVDDAVAVETAGDVDVDDAGGFGSAAAEAVEEPGVEEFDEAGVFGVGVDDAVAVETAGDVDVDDAGGFGSAAAEAVEEPRGDESPVVESTVDETTDDGSAIAEADDEEKVDSTDRDVVVGVMPAAVEEPGADVRDRRWPWRIGVTVWALLIVAVAIAGAVITASSLPDVRRAESDVIVRLTGFDFSEIDRQLDSYVVVAESETVIGPAAREVGMSALDLRDAMTVGLVGASAVIRFGVEDVDDEVALAANTALVQQYLSVVNTPADDSLLIFIDGEIAAVEVSLAGIETRLGALASRRSENAARRAGLVASQETSRGRIVALYARRTEIATGVTLPGTSIAAIDLEIADVQAELDAVTSELEEIEAADAADEASQTQLLAEQAAIRIDLARLEDRRIGLGIDQLDEARARVLTSPHMIAGSVTPSATRGGAFGLAVGLTLAVAFVVLVSRLRRRQ